VARSTAITTSHHEDYSFGHLPPTATLPGKLPRHPRNLVIIELILSPILFIAGIHFPSILFHNQGYPKVCPDSPNLPNDGDSLCRNIVIIFLLFVFPDQGLNCFNLKSSRVFFVKFPKLSLFQIRERLQVLCCALELKSLICDLG
jgi:hypothetical protein